MITINMLILRLSESMSLKLLFNVVMLVLYRYSIDPDELYDKDVVERHIGNEIYRSKQKHPFLVMSHGMSPKAKARRKKTKSQVSKPKRMSKVQSM